MLELKHFVVVSEFCAIYDQIVSELKSVDFQTVEKEQTRFQWLGNAKERITLSIQ